MGWGGVGTVTTQRQRSLDGRRTVGFAVARLSGERKYFWITASNLSLFLLPYYWDEA